jgi:flagellar basal-body rod protein FlgF
LADIAAQIGASLDALTREFDVIANNLANAGTTGYKRRCTAFTKALQDQGSGTDSQGGQEEPPASPLDFSQGNLVATGRTLDFALHGKGFFVLETPDGPLYTRHGVFQTNQNGQMTDMSGRVVAGAGGPIAIPSDVDPSDLYCSTDGRISAGGAEIGQFRIVEFRDKENQLIPTGSTCFVAPKDVAPADVESPVVQQGYQEASNVRLVDELVNMIMVSRLYESNMRMVNTKKDTTDSMINVAMG